MHSAEIEGLVPLQLSAFENVIPVESFESLDPNPTIFPLYPIDTILLKKKQSLKKFEFKYLAICSVNFYLPETLQMALLTPPLYLLYAKYVRLIFIEFISQTEIVPSKPNDNKLSFSRNI